jgi:hypothetical protein
MEMTLPDTIKIETQSKSTEELVNHLVIKTEADYKDAVEISKGIKFLTKEIKSTFKEPKQKAHEAHKSITAAEKKHLDPLVKLDKVISTKILSYQLEQQRIQEIARLEAERVERERIETQALLEAEAMEALGETEEAEAIIEEAQEAEVFVPKIEAVPKVEGVSFRDNWTFEITNPKAIPLEFMMPDEIRIRKYVKMVKGEAKMDGVRFFNKKTFIGRV